MVVDDNDIDRQSHAPGFLRTFFGAVDAPVNNYSQLSIESLHRAVEDLRDKYREKACSNGSAENCLSMFYTVELSFDQISDVNERSFFEHLPTSYALDRKVVDALISRGGTLLKAHPVHAIVLEPGPVGSSGWVLLAELKQRPDLSSVPLILCTSQDERPRGLKLGVTAYLVKPVLPVTLLETVRRLILPASPTGELL